MSDISLHLLNINEFLRSPLSTFGKRKLKTDVEEFLVDEAKELAGKHEIEISVNLGVSEARFTDDIAPAIHKHFRYRREQSQKEYKRTFRYGWRMLFIALGLMAVIFSLTELGLHLLPGNRFVLFVHESFVILGWVALWRPMEILLYDWYPIKTDINLYSRLEHSKVQVFINET